MYNTNISYNMNSGLEQRVGCYSCSNSCSGGGSCSSKVSVMPENEGISYSALEIEILQPTYIVDSRQPFQQHLNIGSYNTSAGYATNNVDYKSETKKEYNSDIKNQQEIIFNPSTFLNPLAPATQFVGDAFEIRDVVERVFTATTGMVLPNDIIMQLVSKQEMVNATKSESVTGFCINRKGFGASNIVVMKGHLDSVMLTVGHEIGHALSMPLTSNINEEAKAFAFSMAWMEAIRKHDIGNLRANILPNPAKNGVHNVAFDFVVSQIENGKLEGKNALDIYREIATGKLRCKK